MASPTDIRPPFTQESARAKVQAAENATTSPALMTSGTQTPDTR